eukprot:646965_1
MKMMVHVNLVALRLPPITVRASPRHLHRPQAIPQLDHHLPCHPFIISQQIEHHPTQAPRHLYWQFHPLATKKRTEDKETENNNTQCETSVSLEGLVMTVEGNENIDEDTVNDVNDNQCTNDGYGNGNEYQNNVNIAKDEFIVSN